MTGQRYIGPDATTDPEVAYQDYVDGIKAADMDSAEIDAAIDAGLNAYATRTYVDTRDGLLATQSYIDAQDNLRVKRASKDVANGVAGLDSSGKVAPGHIDAPITQRYVRGPWTPAAYNTGIIAATLEQTVYPCTVTDPGFPYKLVVFGHIDSHGYLGETPIATVRVGNATSGEIIASGIGASDSMETALLGDDFERPNAATLGSMWEESYGVGNGRMTVNNGRAVFDGSGITDRTGRYRNLGPNSQYSASNYQKITADVEYRGETWDAGFGFNSAQHLRLFGRVNDAFTAYVGLEVRWGDARWFYANPNTSGTEQWLTDYFPTSLAGDALNYISVGTKDNPRRFQWYRDGVLVNTFNDDSALTAMGPTFRGWGFGTFAPNRLDQRLTFPPRLNGIYVTDQLENFAPLHLVPKGLDTQTVRTGATTLYVRLSRLGSLSSVSASNYKPKLHVMAVPA